MKQNQFSTKAVRLLALASIASMTMAFSPQASADSAEVSASSPPVSAGWKPAGPFATSSQCNQMRIRYISLSYKVTDCKLEAIPMPSQWLRVQWNFYYAPKWSRW